LDLFRLPFCSAIAREREEERRKGKEGGGEKMDADVLGPSRAHVREQPREGRGTPLKRKKGWKRKKEKGKGRSAR